MCVGSQVGLLSLQCWGLRKVQKSDPVKLSETDGNQIVLSIIDNFYCQTNICPRSACSWAGAVITEVQPIHTF